MWVRGKEFGGYCTRHRNSAHRNFDEAALRGNVPLISRAYGTNRLNQVTSAGTAALDYDGRGHLTSSGASLYGYSSESEMLTGPRWPATRCSHSRFWCFSCGNGDTG
jgi:hypothetical protein